MSRKSLKKNFTLEKNKIFRFFLFFICFYFRIKYFIPRIEKKIDYFLMPFWPNW